VARNRIVPPRITEPVTGAASASIDVTSRRLANDWPSEPWTNAFQTNCPYSATTDPWRLNARLMSVDSVASPRRNRAGSVGSTKKRM
jgi:hypothetical protein